MARNRLQSQFRTVIVLDRIQVEPVLRALRASFPSVSFEAVRTEISDEREIRVNSVGPLDFALYISVATAVRDAFLEGYALAKVSP